MRKLFLITLCLAALSTVLACTPEKVSFDTVEDSRRQARENAETIAVTFRRDNPQYQQLDLYMRGDSTISAECPQGDGWATIDLRDKEGKTSVQIKCSTVSLSLGCLEASDFKTKSYASEDGKCNHDIPFPLPKLSK